MSGRAELAAADEYRDDAGCVRVGALKRILEHFDDNDLVILSKDGEGNGFSPLSEAEDNHYEAETTWMGEMTGDGPGERCVLLWPIN